MQWNSFAKKVLRVPHRIRRRSLFAWVPRLGSDLKWRWLEGLVRWEYVDGQDQVAVLDEISGKCVDPSGYSGPHLYGLAYELKEGKPKRRG